MNNSRTLKFRVWDTKNKKFLEHVPKREYMLDSDEWSHHDIDEMGGGYYLPSPIYDFNGRLVISQFTGLLDKNNKEIYEGDILRFYTSNYEGAFNRELQGAVRYNSILARYNVVVLESYKDGCYDMNECCEKEIIGNIYQNRPENQTTEKVVGDFISDVPKRTNACPTCDCEETNVLEKSQKLAKEIWETSMEDGYNS